MTIVAQPYSIRKAPSEYGDGWLNTEHQNIQRGISSAVIGYLGANVRNVMDYGPKGKVGMMDAAIDTAAFLDASQSTIAFGSLVPAIVVAPPPPVGYALNSTVYLRKSGAMILPPYTACQINWTGAPNGTMFKMGAGLIAGVPTFDPGGLAPISSGGWFQSAISGVTAFDTTGVSGWLIEDPWFTIATGVLVGGTDGWISKPIYDVGVGSGQLLQILNASHIKIIAPHVYGGNFGMKFQGTNEDITVIAPEFNYLRNDAFLFDTGSSSQGVNIIGGNILGSTTAGYYSASTTHYRVKGDVELVVVGTRGKYSRDADVVVEATGSGSLDFTNCKFRNQFGNHIQNLGTAAVSRTRPRQLSADRGDANVTLDSLVDAETQVFNTPLSVNRTITLDTTHACQGDLWKVVRTAAATGASTLTIAGKALALGQWATAQYNGSAWIETDSGSL